MSEDGGVIDGVVEAGSDLIGAGQDAAEAAQKGFETRVIGVVVSWFVGVFLSIYLEIWTMIFRAGDALAAVPRTIQRDLEGLWWTIVRDVFGTIAGLYEGLLVSLVSALGPFGWIGAFVVTAVMLFALSLVARAAIRVIPFL